MKEKMKVRRNEKKMKYEKIYPDHFDVDSNEITVVTCENCGNQVRKEQFHWLKWHDENIKCCDNPEYYYGIFIPVDDLVS